MTRRPPLARTRLAPLALALLAACGDNLAALPEGTVADAGSGTEPDAAPTPDSGPTSSTAFAVATDFVTTGVASTVAIPEPPSPPLRSRASRRPTRSRGCKVIACSWSTASARTTSPSSIRRA